MPKNEDGEFELVVGNKQLLSIVFILMVLFGVVFSMGYFLGRANPAGEGTAAAAPAPASGQGRPDAAGAQSAPAPAATDRELQPGEATVATPDAGTGTTPVSSTTPVASENPAREAAAPPPPVPESKPAAAPVKQAAPTGDGPAPGQTYLQVAAVKKPQAEVLVEVLKEKGFRAILSPVTVDGTEVYRALVGPVKDASDLAKTKTELERAGIKSFVKKF